jgi:hypothetical protein
MEINDIKENYGNGWIKLFRSIRMHWIWEDPVKLKWWLDILLEVNHSGKKVNIGYEIFDCKRGQSVMSLQNWAERWKTSKDTVRNFFKLLEKDAMITHENLHKTTRLTVCNYDSYQAILHEKPTTSPRDTHDKPTTSHPNKNGNNEENVKNEYKYAFVDFVYRPYFEKWLKYKSERKESYKSKTSIESCYNKLLTMSNKDSDKFEQIIEQSIANNWAGLFELKPTSKQQGESVDLSKMKFQ